MAPHSSTLAWKNPMDGGAWQAAVHGVVKSWIQLSDFAFTFQFHALEREIAAHSSVLAGESQGRGSLVGCHLWGRTESDTTEVTQQQQYASLYKDGIFESREMSICKALEKQSAKCIFSKIFMLQKKMESRDQRKIDGYRTADSHRQEKTEPASYKALSRAELCQREVIARKNCFLLCKEKK